MNDRYIIPYNSDNTILMYLLTIIPEISICKKVLKHKKNLENIDIMEYYMERWENIAGEHYYMHDNHTNQFSYIYLEGSDIQLYKKQATIKDIETFLSYKFVKINEFNIQSNVAGNASGVTISDNRGYMFNNIVIPADSFYNGSGVTSHKSKKMNYICSINPTTITKITGTVTDLDGGYMLPTQDDSFVAEFVFVARK